MIFTRPQLRAIVEFEGADIWGEPDAEEYYDKTGIECALRWLDDSVVPQSGAAAEWLRDNPTFFTIGAFRRERVPTSYIESWAEGVAEHLREGFSEEHGNPNDGEDGLSDDDVKELNRRALDLATWYVSKATVYTCESLRRFTLDSEDILELVQQCRPHWLLSPT